MASATFNKQIVSSNSDITLEYKLDKVISKDFNGKPNYTYKLGEVVKAPEGVFIESRGVFGSYLIIPPFVEFDLFIIVSNGDRETPIEATATTIVTIEGKPDFNKIKEEFYKKSNFEQKKEESAQNWVNILSERIPNNEESVVSAR